MNGINNSILNIVYIELPTIETGISIGRINLDTNEVSIEDSNLIRFTCESRVECCSNLKIPVTEFDTKRIEARGYDLDQIISSLSNICCNN